jgi:hypothetical protein
VLGSDGPPPLFSQLIFSQLLKGKTTLKSNTINILNTKEFEVIKKNKKESESNPNVIREIAFAACGVSRCQIECAASDYDASRSFSIWSFVYKYVVRDRFEGVL